MSRLLGLYPRVWRRRYEAEFRALALVGLIALAVGARRSGHWSIGASFAVVGSCTVAVGVVLFAMAMSDGDRLAGAAFQVYLSVALVPAWLGVGATLIRSPG